MRFRLHAFLSVCVAALIALVVVPASAQAVDDPENPLAYVALGDSFSAGSGVVPLDRKASPLCARSILNYPNVIAAATGAQLTDVTCGGARTADFYTSQYPRVPPQLEALRPDTELVTLTIGGNDNATFIGAVVACGAAGLTTLGAGNPCQKTYGSRFDDQIETKTFPAIKKALADIKARSPQARVAILGYPWLLPPTKGCFTKMPVAKGDVPYLRSIQAHLNDAARRAAAETGATFVDMSVVSEGRDACASRKVRWVEPVLGTLQPVPVHPNARGEQGMADEAMRVLGL